ncbi:MAG: thioredoxin family protein, partial [Nitrospira sp.]|nr:thioredoxin family protein [Nitrospira sp.]
GDFTAETGVGAAEPRLDPARTDAHGFYLDFDYAVAEAKRVNKPLLIDFNGVNCKPCRVMEKTVFTMPEVKKLFENFVVVSLITDIDDEKADALMEEYGPPPGVGIPWYVVVGADGKEKRAIGSTLPKTKGGPSRAHLFVAFLKGEQPDTGTDSTGNGEAEALPEGWPEGLPAPPVDYLRERFDSQAKFTADKVAPGAEVTLELHFKMKAGKAGYYHLYHPDTPFGMGSKPEFTGTGVLKPDGGWAWPEPHVVPGDENTDGKDEWLLEGHSVAVYKFAVPADAKPGEYLVTGTFTGQVCDSKGCLPIEPFGWVARLTVSADGEQSALAQPSMDFDPDALAAAKSGDQLSSDIDSKGLLLVLLTIFGLGLVTLATPCVLPVLPLTIGFFVKQSEQKRSPLLTAFIYCTCIVASYAIIGFITSWALGASGAQILASNAWVNIFLGLLFGVFALSFFGLFELRVPTFVTRWFSRRQMDAQKESKGYLQAFLSGSSFSLITFSCTAPIAAIVLARAASGEFWLPTLAMVAYASGMAFPIFLMGQFPAMMRKMPKSGGWMNAIKVVFAFIEVALAVTYFSQAEMAFIGGGESPVVISRTIVIATWAVCSVLAGVYLLGLFRLPHDHEETRQIGVVRLLFATFFLVFGVYMTPGLDGRAMGYLDGILPPGEAHDLPWARNLEAAIERSKAQGKPVFVDFTGINCKNCRWVEYNIFTKQSVYRQLEEDFILVQQWTDDPDDPAARENWSKFGNKAVPFYVVLDQDGRKLDELVPDTFITSLTEKEFAE